MKRFLIFVAACGLISPDLAVSKPPQQVAAREYNGSSICSFDRILLGPDRAAFAVWKSEGDRLLGTRYALPPLPVIIGQYSGSSGQPHVRLTAYSGGGLRLYPIRWADSGSRLYIRVRERTPRIIAVDQGSSAVDEAAGLDPAWRLFDVGAATHGDVAALTDPRNVVTAGLVDGVAIVRGVATLGRTAQMLGVRAHDMQVVRLEENRTVPTQVNAVETRLLSAFENSDQFDDGLAYVGAPRRETDLFIPYQAPIVDLNDGRTIGVFGPRRLHLDQAGPIQAVVADFHRAMRVDAVITDVSFSHDTLMVLATAFNGTQILYRLSPAGLSQHQLCDRPQVLPHRGPAHVQLAYQRQLAAVRDLHPRIDIFTLGHFAQRTLEPGRPIIVRYSLGGPGPRDAIVRFPGGPGGTSFGQFFPNAVLRLLSPERDVISVEYSGSVGGGPILSRQLRNGMSAINGDIDALASWLRNEDYGRVSVLGESFGGVPALRAVTRHRQLFSQGFFVAPVLTMHDAADRTGTGISPRPTDVRFQDASEFARFGDREGRTRFSADLRAMLTGGRLTSRDRFYFGETDRASAPAHLPAEVPSARYVALGANHQSVFNDEYVWSDILSHLAQPPSDR